MKYKKKGLSRVLCLFIIFSLLGGGWVSSPFFLGGQAYASEASGDVIGGNDITDNNGDGEEGSGDNGENGDGEEGSGDNGENGDGEEGSGDNGENGDGEEGSGDNGENEDGEEGSGDNGENGDGEEDSGDNGENGDGEEDSDKKDEAEELNDDEEETGEVIVGDFTVSGGEQGTDYKFEGNTLIIIGSAPLVIKNTAETGFTTNNIHIGDDEHTEVTANVTLAGVRIQNTATNDSPFNIMGTDKTCYLTLAEGSVNTLNASKLFSAALHCGKNSTVVIDGSGTLNAYGGSSCSGIGSGFNEIAGKLVFNGGTINAHAFRYETTGADVPADNTLAQYNNGWAATAKHQKSGGAGIGAGGKGGASEIIINGGTIHAYGSAHGAGIGASYAFDEVGKVQLGTVGSSNADPKHLTCGDITINGGYITSKGYVHGGAFGASCGTTAKGCTITVNGGTLLPYASKSDSGGLNKDFNGCLLYTSRCV